MCNLYSITTNQAAIIALFRVVKGPNFRQQFAEIASLWTLVKQLQHGGHQLRGREGFLHKAGWTGRSGPGGT